MATFPAIAPIHPAPKRTAPINSNTLLGDGYEVSVRFGLNNVRPEWSLTWETTAANSTAIDDFLQARADAGQAFDWQPPDTTYPLQWRCDEWSVEHLAFNWRRVNATFRQVFEIPVDSTNSGFDLSITTSLISGSATINSPEIIGTFINSDANTDASHVLTTPAHNPGNLLIAVLMWRLPAASITPPSGWTLYRGDLLPSIVLAGSQQNLHVYTKTATASEPVSYTWSAGSSVRNAGLIVSVERGDIASITENYGNAATATITTAPTCNGLSITVFTWIYALDVSETYSQSSSTGILTQITDSPKNRARLSGGYTKSAATVTSTHASTTATDNPNHGGICILVT
jgi:phage-related protein